MLFMMLATVLSQIEHKNTTRPIDKLRKQIRKVMKHLPEKLMTPKWK